VGRDWARTEFHRFLKEEDSKRYFLIMGKPGCGKTAFLADYVCYDRKTDVENSPYHFIGKGMRMDFDSSCSSWNSPALFIQSVGYQLMQEYGEGIMEWERLGLEALAEVGELQGELTVAKIREYEAMPYPPDVKRVVATAKVKRLDRSASINVIHIEKLLAKDIETPLLQYVVTPLKHIAKRNPNRQFIVIIDALDEADNQYWGDRNIFKILLTMDNIGMNKLPNNVRFLLSTQRGKHPELEQKLMEKKATTLWFSEDNKGEIKHKREIDSDIKLFVTNLAESETIQGLLIKNDIDTDFFINSVIDACKRNFLYLHYLKQGLVSGDIDVSHLEQLPTDLIDLYNHFVKIISMEVSETDWTNQCKPMLGILAVAKEPLSLKQLVNLSGAKKPLEIKEEIRAKKRIISTKISRMEQFFNIITPDKGKKLFTLHHPSFREFLVSDDNEDLISAEEAHEDIVHYYTSKDGLWRKGYAMKHLIHHMIESDSWDKLMELLTDTDYLTKKQESEQQYLFQNDIITLIRNNNITNDTLTEILATVLKTVVENMEESKEKADWLDIFAYWLDEFGYKYDKLNDKRRQVLKEVANKFDHACGDVSARLVTSYLEKGEEDWALRFAELSTWVYQRSEDFGRCVEACEKAEKLCIRECMDKAYRILARAEFIRMRAKALNELSKLEKDEGKKAEYKQRANEAYSHLNEVLAAGTGFAWEPAKKEWQILESDDKAVLGLPKLSDSQKRIQVVSNTHDSISAIHIIQSLQQVDAKVEWIHTSEFKSENLAPMDTILTILIGGPKAPGISSVAHKFYEQEKEQRKKESENKKSDFLELYSASGMVSKILTMKEGETLCCMAGGPSKINTLKAAYDLLDDPDVRQIIGVEPDLS